MLPEHPFVFPAADTHSEVRSEISVDDFAARYEGPDADDFALYCNVHVGEG